MQSPFLHLHNNAVYFSYPHYNQLVYGAATQLSHWWGVYLKVEWPPVLLMDRPEAGKLMLAMHERNDLLISQPTFI